MRWEIVVWTALALILFAFETFVPGAFMLWIGLAASVMALMVWLVPDINLVWQATWFILLSFTSILIFRKWFRGNERQSDQPLLNRKSSQLIGQIHLLDQAIINGRGRVKIGDAYWVVQGSDLSVGSKIEIVSTEGTILHVKPA